MKIISRIDENFVKKHKHYTIPKIGRWNPASVLSLNVYHREVTDKLATDAEKAR